MMRGFAAIGLYAPCKEPNIGGALRAAACYDADLLVIQGGSFSRSAANTTATERHIPLVLTDDILSVRPHGSRLIAVEFMTDAEPLPTFRHPQQAFYVFGPEGGSVPNRIIDVAQHVVFVPTKHCMNLAATVNVVLYDRLAKQSRRAERPDA